MIIPGFIIAWLTFPGVIVHEAGHFLLCRWRGVAVLDACFFRFGNPAGYVVHEETERFADSFFIGMGPFFVNTALCLLFCLPAFIPVWELETGDPLSYGFYWLGISIGMHAFPSTHDLSNIWRLARPAMRAGNLFAILSFPLVAVLYAANFLRFFWIDLLYGIGVGVGIPLTVFRALA